MADTKITGLTVGVPLSTDVIPYVSDPGGSPVTKKTLVSSIAPTPTKMAGDTVQAIHMQSSAEAHGANTELIPYDDTIPQNTEGKALTALDTAITPTSATNRLLIEVLLNASCDTIAFVTVALFQDTTAGALSTTMTTIPAINYMYNISLKFEMAAGTTSATTFKLRFGGNVTSVTTINGVASARKYGGTMYSSMRVTEVKV